MTAQQKQKKIDDIGAIIKEVEAALPLIDAGIAVGPGPVLMKILTDRRTGLEALKQSKESELAAIMTAASIGESRDVV